MIELLAFVLALGAFVFSVLALLTSHGRREKRGAVVSETPDEDPRLDLDAEEESIPSSVRKAEAEARIAEEQADSMEDG